MDRPGSLSRRVLAITRVDVKHVSPTLGRLPPVFQHQLTDYPVTTSL